MVTLLPSFFPSRLRGFVDIFFPKTVAHPSCKINSATYDVPVRLSINLNLSPLFSTAISCISSRAIFGWILFELNSSCGDLGERVEVFCLLSEYCRLNHTLCSQPFSSKQKTSASVLLFNSPSPATAQKPFTPGEQAHNESVPAFLYHRVPL